MYTIVKYSPDSLLLGEFPYDTFGSDESTRIQKFNLSLQYLLRQLSPDLTLPEGLLLPERSDILALAIDKNHGIVACARLIEVERFGRFFGYVEDVITREDFRKLGLASELIQKLLKMSKSGGLYKVILCCASDKIGFYEQFGFKANGVSMRVTP